MMHCLSAAFFFLLSMLRDVVIVESFNRYRLESELDDLNFTCIQEKCAFSRDDSPDKYHEDSLVSYNCQCGIHCAQLGTCCYDSFYANAPKPKLKPACVYNEERLEEHFIVDHCPFNDSVWASLCNSEWEEEDDLLKIVPVTSIFTTMSYKNYYCFRCHETTDDFRYWSVKFGSNHGVYHLNSSGMYPYDPDVRPHRADENNTLTYDKELKTWLASVDEESDYFPVQLFVTTSDEIDKLTHRCFTNIISDCSDDWTDEEVREKCQWYMAIKEVEKNGTTLMYKNAHCVLCNFESMDSINCRHYTAPMGSDGYIWSFSFSYLLDINRSDGELVGKVQKCSEDQLWDPFSKKCRKLACALPGHKYKNGKCVSE